MYSLGVDIGGTNIKFLKIQHSDLSIKKTIIKTPKNKIKNNVIKLNYPEKFSEFKEFTLPIWEENADPSWFGFPISISKYAKFTRLDLLKHYEECGIGTRLLFGGNVLLQPAYYKKGFGNPQDYPVANKVVDSTFWIGVYPGITDEMLNFIYDATLKFLKENS